MIGSFIILNQKNVTVPITPIIYSYGISVAVGYSHTLMIDTSNNVYGWGSDAQEQLNKKGSTYTAISMNITQVSSVACGDMYSAVLGINKKLSTFGNAAQGQLGNNSYFDQKISEISLPPIKFITCGRSSTYAIGVDGSLSACGSNYYGQLGNNTTTNTNVFVKVNNLPPIETIYASNHVVVLDSFGGLSAWGYNDYGQIGDNTIITRLSAVKINLPPVKSVACGRWHTMALGDDGTVSAWGYNGYGGLGDGSDSSNIPIKLNLQNVEQIYSTAFFNMALGRNGILSAWADNSYGKLGDGSNTQRRTPVKVDPVTPNVRI